MDLTPTGTWNIQILDDILRNIIVYLICITFSDLVYDQVVYLVNLVRIELDSIYTLQPYRVKVTYQGV